MVTLNSEKYENAILFLCSHRPNKSIHGIKKMAKLLYFLDFDRFEWKESMETVTGDVYRRLPMGPYPSSLTKVAAVMARSGRLSIEERQEYQGYNQTTVYTALVEPDLSVFSDDDLAMLKRVSTVYSDMTGYQLETLSHTEAPWLAVEHRDVIPFELAFYRDTDFQDAA